MTTLRLCDATLASLPHDIARPACERARTRIGIVHRAAGGPIERL